MRPHGDLSRPRGLVARGLPAGGQAGETVVEHAPMVWWSPAPRGIATPAGQDAQLACHRQRAGPDRAHVIAGTGGKLTSEAGGDSAQAQAPDGFGWRALGEVVYLQQASPGRLRKAISAIATGGPPCRDALHIPGRTGCSLAPEPPPAHWICQRGSFRRQRQHR